MAALNRRDRRALERTRRRRRRKVAAAAGAGLAVVAGGSLDAGAAVVTTVDSAGRLTVVLSGGDDVFVGCNNGELEVNSASPAGGPFACSSITAIAVTGDDQSNDIVLLNVDPGPFTGLDGDITVNGGGGDDSLFGSGFGDSIAAGANADFVTAQEGPDTVLGGTGQDLIEASSGSDSILGGLDTDTVRQISTDGDMTLTNTTLATPTVGIDTLNGVESASLEGGGSANVLDASAWTNGPVTLHGETAGDSLVGGSGPDVLIGSNIMPGDGNDTLAGGDGADTLRPRFGDDSVDGGGGQDQLNGSGAGHWVLTNTTLTEDVTDVHTYANTELVLLNGGAASDTLDASAYTAGPVSLLGQTGADSLLGGTGNDNLNGAGSLDTSSDTLVGNAGNDTLRGDDGEDSLDGGGAETDLLSEGFLSGATLTNTELVVNTTNDVLADIEHAQLAGTLGDNTMNASGFTLGPVTLTGGQGNDSLVGSGQSDSLPAGDGADTVSGGEGADIVEGGPVVDSLLAGGGNDTMSGGGGADSIVAFTGTDLLLESVSADSVLQNTFFTSGAITDSLSGIEHAHLSDTAGSSELDASAFTLGDVTLQGGPGNDRLVPGGVGGFVDGEADDDTVVSGPDDDVMTGGPGTDLLEATNNADFELTDVGGDVVTLQGDGDNDTISGVEGAQLEGGPASTNLLDASGTALPVTLLGLAGTDTLLGGSANDVLNGGDDDDALNGGGGIDRVRQFGLADVLLTDTLLGPASDTLTSIERAELQVDDAGRSMDASGFSGPVSLYGGLGADTITGGPQADSLFGNPGNDSITGLGGADSLVGFTGNDTLMAQDGVAERADCGDGAADFAVADLTDTRIGCESASLPPQPPPPDQGAAGGVPPPAGQPPVVVTDSTAPRLGVGSRITVSPEGRVQLSLSCPASESVCQGALELTTTESLASQRRKRRRARRLGRTTFSIDGGRKRTVRLRLSKTGFAVLKKRKRLRAKLSIRVADAARNSRLSSRSVTLKAPRRKRS